MIDFYRVKVTHVVDGDTFKGDLTFGVLPMTLHSQKFRLMGIDTPERKQQGFYEATEYTANEIEGKDVIVFLHGQDSFGRWLVDVYIEGIHETLNSRLLDEGLAVVWKN